MTHELKHIIQKAFQCYQKGEKCVLASVVALDGTSYRKPGVRMLITDSGEMVGAVSGGCVEKDVQQRAQMVFETGQPLVMAYDGRFRLGCQGTLYILIEPIEIDESTFNLFQEHLEKRDSISLVSYYEKKDNAKGAFGTVMHLGKINIPFNVVNEKLETLNQKLTPCFKLLIIGAEHDAVKLCTLASNMGWEVEVVSSWRDPKTLTDFPGAKEVWSLTPELLDVSKLDNETAVVLMTHNYALDLKYLLELRKASFAYLGVLGSQNRNDELRSALFEHTDGAEDLEFYGPIGLNIGSETPEEIAISIISEILAVTRNKEVPSLSSHKTSVPFKA